VEYGVRLASPADAPRDPRDACPPEWRSLLPEGSTVALYFGTEFCEDRLPDAAEANAFCALARERGWEPVLLTPLVTPEGLRTVDRLLTGLTGEHWKPAVVFNDWGVLGLLRERHPSLSRRAGRLMNRSLRDPRAYRDAPAGSATHDTARYQRLRRFFSVLGVTAIETDVDLDGGYLGDGPDAMGVGDEPPPRSLRSLPPEGELSALRAAGQALSRALHVPFTFAASGRICPLKAGLYPEGSGFAKALAAPCPAPCRGKPLPVQRPDTTLPHWRGGNTVFYEVPREVVRTWLPRTDRIVLHEAAAP
jgi:hypothetical protein